MSKVRRINVYDLDENMQEIYFCARREMCIQCMLKLSRYEKENNCIIVED